MTIDDRAFQTFTRAGAPYMPPIGKMLTIHQQEIYDDLLKTEDPEITAENLGLPIYTVHNAITLIKSKYWTLPSMKTRSKK